MSTSWIKVCSPQNNSTESYYVSCTNFTFYYHFRTMDFTWSSLSSFLMRIEITWSKVESTTFLLLTNALDLFRNVLDRCFIEITLSKVKSIFFFEKCFWRIRYVMFDDELESSIKDICHRNSDAIYGTANSDTWLRTYSKFCLISRI